MTASCGRRARPKPTASDVFSSRCCAQSGRGRRRPLPVSPPPRSSHRSFIRRLAKKRCSKGRAMPCEETRRGFTLDRAADRGGDHRHHRRDRHPQPAAGARLGERVGHHRRHPTVISAEAAYHSANGGFYDATSACLVVPAAAGCIPSYPTNAPHVHRQPARGPAARSRATTAASHSGVATASTDQGFVSTAPTLRGTPISSARRACAASAATRSGVLCYTTGRHPPT